jgi:hypothetical protein
MAILGGITIPTYGFLLLELLIPGRITIPVPTVYEHENGMKMKKET